MSKLIGGLQIRLVVSHVGVCVVIARQGDR